MLKAGQLFDASTHLGKYYKGSFNAVMNKREAELILNLKYASFPHFQFRHPMTEEKIKEAHKKMILLNHPDRGGCTYIANKVNEAKETLLKSGI